MFLPSAAIDGTDTILDTINTQLILAHANDGSILEVRRIRDGIVAVLESLPVHPSVPKYGDRPVCRGDMTERVEKDRIYDELVQRQ